MSSAAKVVIVSGVSGAGKTFAGDYLEMCHGFIHVDGDYFFQNDNRSKLIVEGIKESFKCFWFEEKRAPVQMWHPYYNALAEIVRKTEKENPGKRIVLTHSVYTKECRNYFWKLLPGHQFVMLNIDGEELQKRHFQRFKKSADAQNTPVEELYTSIYKEEYTEENFRKQTNKILQGLEGKQEGEEHVFEVDVAGDVFEGLQEVLELGETPNPMPIEEIASKKYDQFETLNNYGRFETSID